MVERTRLRSQVVAINLCAYGIISNHYNLVMHVTRCWYNHWSNEEVPECWSALYKTPLARGDLKSKAEVDKTLQPISEWHEHLQEIFWFVRNLNEFISRKANLEEG